MKIAINAGHCPGLDSGAVGHRVTEAEVTKEIGLAVVNYLANVGYETMFIQENELADICDKANDWGADLFVSIHCNAANGRAYGTETFGYYGSELGSSLAHHIQSQIVNSIGTENRGVKEAGYYVLRHTDCPAVLVECAFIDNWSDETLLIEQADDFARAIARGVTDYVKWR